jgi:cytochrome c biogenesis protein ResB
MDGHLVNTNDTNPARSARRELSALQRLGDALASTKLAIALLVGVLACCLVGVTVVRGERAWQLIFSTLWFNALLVLLALSSAAAFFTRIWRRKLTLVSVGMILFHLSFAALLGGVVYNGLFHFKGVLRLTEGETLRNGVLASYDSVEHGRFFDFRRLRGETTLLKVHPDYRVEGQAKRAAYEISVGQGARKTTGTIYVTKDLEHDGVRFLCLKEGYSLLVVMSDASGREIYGAHIALQSHQQPDGSYVFETGSATYAAPFPFPPPPETSRGELLVSFRPNAVVERDGDVTFSVWPVGATGDAAAKWTGTVKVGGQFTGDGFRLNPREVRYWVGMDVRYDPGLNVVLASLCVGLGGMVLTLVGRVRQGPRGRSA